MIGLLFMLQAVPVSDFQAADAFEEISGIIIPVEQCERTFLTRDRESIKARQKLSGEWRDNGELSDEDQKVLLAQAKSIAAKVQALKLEKQKACGKEAAEREVEAVLIKLNPGAHVSDLKRTSFNLFLNIGGSYNFLNGYKTGDFGPRPVAPPSPSTRIPESSE